MEMQMLLSMRVEHAADLMKKGELSVREVTSYFLERIRETDGKMHAFITVDADGAMARAAALDACPVSERKGRLFGVPMSVKDNILTSGIRTTAGSAFLKDFVPQVNAEVTARLLREGAVILGKTNLDEFGMGSATRNEIYGYTVNPRDPKRSPGGSSGGAAAAVGAGLCMVSIGTDTGGSVRQPAACCGLYGLKPSYGAVSRYGLIAYASSMDQAGIIGRYPEDLQLVLSVISGKDEKDATSLPLPEEYLKESPLSGCKVGVPEEFLKENISSEVRNAVIVFEDFLRSEGAEVTHFSFTDISLFVPVYYMLACCEASSNLGRYDGIRYGTNCSTSEELRKMYQENRTAGFSDEVRKRILMGTYMLSEENYTDLYLKAMKARKLIRRAYAQAFKRFDLLLSPCIRGKAPYLTDPVIYDDDIFTVGANLAELPACAVPVGGTSVQLTGNRMMDGLVLSAASGFSKGGAEK